MRGTFKFGVKKVVTTIFTLLAFATGALAQEISVKSVSLSKPAELEGAYQLTIKADAPIEYKTKVKSQDSIYFDLKNAVTVDNLDTIYDDVSDIDGVIVQQLENKVRIYVNGLNTQNTKLVFKTAQQNASAPKDEVVLNRPLREYMPVVDTEEVFDENINWDENSFNPEHLLASFFGLFEGKADMTLMVCLSLLVLSIVISKKVFAKIKLQEEPLIGLSSAYQKDFEQTEEIKQMPALNKPSKQKQPQVNPALKYASNNYSSILPKQKPRMANTNAIKQNYALGAYQNSQKNPYITKTHNAQPLKYPNRAGSFAQSSNSFVTKPQVRATNVSSPKANVSADNIKFLESVTKIYEQSGRADLAQGLREGVHKRKTAV